VVAALAGATIAVPLADLASPAPGSAAALTASGVYPSSYDVLSQTVADSTPTTLLAPAREVSRDATTVSRSVTRDPLPECDTSVGLDSPNGQIPADDLCTLWDGTNALRGDAAVSFTELDDAFRAAFGRDLCLTASYRTLAEQRRLAVTKPGLAATPGTSNHGWGLAVDFCGSEVATRAVMTWLADSAPAFGWDNPAWARRGGSGAFEPWHWEYVPGTTALGTNYG
jgi:LAS superfamily LD-carboxypeptidase LdcB